MTTKRRVNVKKSATKILFPLTAKIRLVAKENPHRNGTNDFAKFKKLSAGMTVAKALATGVDRGYLRYMVGRELISIA